ncbi:Spectrin beta chain, partial [Araneus ventricosus]
AKTDITEVDTQAAEREKKAEVLRPSSLIQKPFEGPLMRKHNFESATKRATNRSWEKVYLLVKDRTLYTYKDQKHCKQEPDNFYHGEPPIDLRGSDAGIALDYTKRRHVLKLRLAGGGEYLFQAKDEEEMLRWLSHLQQASSEETAGPGHSQTLPLRRSEERKDEQKRRSLFSKKK